MFIKRKRLNPDGASGKEQDEREVNNPDISELLNNIDSAVKEADAHKAKQEKRGACNNCFKIGR